jgi:hypothetical protein
MNCTAKAIAGIEVHRLERSVHLSLELRFAFDCVCGLSLEGTFVPKVVLPSRPAWAYKGVWLVICFCLLPCLVLFVPW